MLQLVLLRVILEKSLQYGYNSDGILCKLESTLICIHTRMHMCIAVHYMQSFSHHQKIFACLIFATYKQLAEFFASENFPTHIRKNKLFLHVQQTLSFSCNCNHMNQLKRLLLKTHPTTGADSKVRPRLSEIAGTR